ncbi:MAG: hypothetical protein BWY65_01679 [Firmicutes bacterium ADurb.Bin373]|jgi:hypothetical protein|nr:MAG: hypothetical protein BWY65_01679 [Firmicutes bacterium ADurb.Bin373]
MKITNIGNGKIAVETPYNPEFVSKIKKAGGRWNASSKTWECDERSVEAVRAIMREVYGMDDMPQELVTVRVTVGDRNISKHTGPVVLFGRTIASAYGRDSGAKIGEGVCFEAGGCTSGGSVKNWYTVIESGSIITIYDVPRRAVEEKLGWSDSDGAVEIMEAVDPLAGLKAEREALLKRLTEIDAILSEA